MNTLPVSVINLLRHSWRDIDYTYSLLTPAERECISENEFNRIVEQIRRADAIWARSVPITGPIPLVEIPND